MPKMQQANISWRDNQPYSDDFNDVYFAREGGCAESTYVFLQRNELPQRWLQSDRFVIAETGFGTGLNFLVTAKAWLETSKPDARLYYFSIEKYPLAKEDLHSALLMWPGYADLANELVTNWPAAVTGFHCIALFQRRVLLILQLGDVLDMLCQMTTKVDAWYLDGFAPARNPDMWTNAVFTEMARSSHFQTTFSTYTAAGDVRRGLQDAGFFVAKMTGFGAKRDMLCGHFMGSAPVAVTAPWFALQDLHFKSKKAAVIGAGIAGITTACSLLQRGWHVDMYDAQADFATAGSGNPAGVLLPRIATDDSAEAEFYAAAYFLALRQLSQLQKSNAEIFWNQTGVIQLLSSARLRRQFSTQNLPKSYVCGLSSAEASNLSGIKLNDDVLYYPLAGWLEPRNLCATLLKNVRTQMTLQLNTVVNQLQRTQDSWVLFNGDQHELGRYDVVVLANAQCVSQFSQTQWLNVLPARGQISYLPSTPERQQLACPVCYDGYVLPALNNQHIVGASFASGVDSTELLVEDQQQNYCKLQQSVPDFIGDKAAQSAADINGRAAIRAITPDRMPLVGAVPDLDYFNQHYSDLQHGRPATKYPPPQNLPGLFVNTGHGARGLTSAFLAAELLAAIITGDVLPVSRQVLHALHPARFFIRQSKKGKLPTP